MFKKKQSNQGYVLSENYIPASLPRYGLNLDGFITGDYCLCSDAYIEECYKACDTELASLIQTSDRFTVGDNLDGFIDGQIAFAENKHKEDVASHELQVEHINTARKVRKGVLDHAINQLKENINYKHNEIAPLQGLHSQYELKIGNFYLPVGMLVTLVAMIIDGLLNFSFLEGILLSNGYLLFITVLGLCFLSDGSMFCLGTILSNRKENHMNKWLYYVAVVGFILMFILSAVTCVVIKFGSMDITFGTISATGTFIGKESYSLAEYGVTAVTAVITTATGLISLFFSIDENAPLVNRRRVLEKELKKDIAEYENLIAERDAIEHAVDPMINDRARRQVAEANLQALRIGLKQHVRKMLALHQQESTYTDAMAESAKMLLPSDTSQNNQTESKIIPTKSKTTSFHTDTKLEEVI